MMEASTGFQFWEENLPYGDDANGPCSPQFWRRVCETSPLLPHKHNYSSLSPTSRTRVIVDGKRELMEMIKGLPESYYELSLKDLVNDDQQKLEDDVQEKAVIVGEETKEKQIPQSRNYLHSKNCYIKSRGKSNQITRTESMDSEAFLLKMFLPTSLSSKKKATMRKPSKLLAQESDRHAPAVKSSRKGTNIERSASDAGSSRIRMDEDTWVPFRCSFNKKSKSRRQRGCLF